MIAKKSKGPILSRNKKDPTQSYKALNKTYRNIENRYYQIKLEIKGLFDNYLVGQSQAERESFIFTNGTIYRVNADYIYDMSADELSLLLDRVQAILDGYLLEGGENELWVLQTIADEYRRGTHAAYTNLAHQSSYYGEQVLISQLLSSPAYQNQIAQAFKLTFTDWKGLTETVKTDLSHVIASAIARGINPRETARLISKRLDVSMTKAKVLAQTEQLSAYRNAVWAETEWTNERLGLKTALLHQSAMLPTSRQSHVYWQGRIRTPEEVREWYEQDGNRYNCHCTQIPVLLDESGNIVNPTVVETLTKERDKWFDDNKKSLIPEKTQSIFKSREYTDKSSVKEVNKWAAGKITQISKIPNGVDLKELNECIELVSSIQDRFNLPKFRYIGSITGDTYKYKRDKNMLAAFSPNVNSLLITRKSLNTEFLTETDIISKTNNYKAHSIKVANYTGNKTLIKTINEMEYVPWFAVSTPRGTFAHEMGHVLHNKYASQIDKLVRESRDNGWAFVLSKYSQKDESELVAESFSLFIENKKEAQKRLYPPLFEFFNSIDKGK